MSADVLFGTDHALGILVKAVLFYGYMVFLLRVSGKRTTMSMTSFDFVSTVAMATIVGSTILQSSISLLEGMIAVTALVGLQWVIGLLSARSDHIRELLTSAPAVLVQDGQFDRPNLAAGRISEEQIMQKVRAAGHQNLERIHSVVLESAGTVSVIEKRGDADGSS